MEDGRLKIEDGKGKMEDGGVKRKGLITLH
jgi:hypothetical protein